MKFSEFISTYKKLFYRILSLLLFIVFMFAYLLSGGLYQIVPLPGCTVCAYKVNKVTGRSWYLVRDRQFEVRWEEAAKSGYVFNPHTGRMEPE